MKTFTISEDGYHSYLFRKDLTTRLWLGKVSPCKEVGLDNRFKTIEVNSMKSCRNSALGELTEEQRDAIEEYDFAMDAYMRNHEIEVFSYALRMAQELLTSKDEEKEEDKKE